MQERRSARRYKLALPIEISRMTPAEKPHRLHGTTRDISTCGIYFTLGQPLPLRTRFQFSVTLPAKMIQGIEVLITAQGRVVRVEKRGSRAVERVGIGAVIEKYETVSSEVETRWA